MPTRMRPRPIALATLTVVAAAASAQAPAGYYATVNTSTPALLRSTLHAVIDDHVRIPYTASGTDTWDVLEQADQHPTNSSQILDVYHNAAYAKQGGGNSLYDREHTWPRSYGFPTDAGTNYPFSDCHHLFLSDIAYNGARGNRPYADGLASWTSWPTLVNAGQGGGSGFPGNANWTEGNSTLGSWMTWSSRKGDVARALLYLDVRYEGGTHGTTGAAEPDLRLTDDTNLIAASSTGGNIAIAYMGRLSTLLLWHAQDPVDQKEMARNNAVFAHQGNRNPFVDHPQWVACLFQNQCVRQRGADVWINELHYDNSGVDVNELVEIAGPAGTDLRNFQLVAYDGGTGTAYWTRNLRGVIPNLQNGYGVLAFSPSELQNGAPDGIALIAPGGVVLQFLGYEGSFTAIDGPAAGRVAVDLGQSETSTTAVGHSLQLGGTGNLDTAFAWQVPMDDTPGAVNRNQVLQ
jgi:endonuclease I